MTRILIIGATSAIAEAVARQYAERGARLFLAARNGERLDTLAKDLDVRGAQVTTQAFAAEELSAHTALIDSAIEALGEIDIALIAHGTLPDQDACAASVETSLREFAVNGTSVIALSTLIAQRLQAPATLAVISSVAGDRGRASNYLYGSAKAAVSTFTAGLRQALNGSGVNVLTIKPGFVDTPMTATFKKGALWAQPEQVARGIIRAIDKRRSVAYLPGFWWAIMQVITHIPEFVFRRIKL